jgi:hypothetical protein
MCLCKILKCFAGHIVYVDEIKIDTSLPTIHQLAIGEQVPDIMLDTVHFYPGSRARFSELLNKGALLIIFWDMQCSSCIRVFPELLAMQQANKDKLQLLLVADEHDSTVLKFFAKQKQLTGIDMTLPLVCNNNALNILFTHNTSPHNAWIDHSGKLKFITDGEPLTMKNVVAFANHEHIDLTLKTTEEELPYNPVKPLFFEGYGGTGKGLTRYTILSKYITGMPWVQGIAKDTNRSIMLSYNLPVKAMYQSAYNDLPNNSLWIPDNRTIMRVRDSSKYVFKVNDVMQTQNYWCYQLITPPMDDKALKKIMQSDLDKYFGLHSRIEKQVKLCWVLRAKDTNLIRSAGGKFEDFHDVENFTLVMKNLKMSGLIRRFAFQLLETSPYPFINDTHYTGNVDMVLENVVYNYPLSIQKALQKYKMTLKLEKRKIDMLVISDH